LLKINTKKTGQNAEEIAKHYLLQSGLSYVQSNFYSRFGEIDLIFSDKDTLVFIEVRYRKNNQYGHSFETINQQKQNRIIKTAQYYLQKKRLTESVNCRFDVIGIEPIKQQTKPSRAKHSINWIKDAFYCS